MNKLHEIILKIFFEAIGVLRHRAGRDKDFSLKMEVFSAVEDMGLSSIETMLVENDAIVDEFISLACKYSLPDQNLTLEIPGNIRLKTIFSQISMDNSFESNLVYPLNELNPEILPLKIESIKEEDGYEGLYKKIIKSSDKITDKDFSDFNNTILAFSSFLEKYLFTVPFSPEFDSVSLFDYALSSVAIATALYRYHEEKQDFSGIEKDDKKFCLIQGYFSGIHPFILANIQKTNKYAGKILRARSFFISISSEIIAHRICNLFQIPPTSIMMNAGGKFTILAPNLKDTQKKLLHLAEKVNKELYKINYGQTKFVFASHSFSNSEFKGKSLHYVFKELCQNFEHKKSLNVPDKSKIQKEIEKISTNELCHICSQHSGKQDSNDENLIICSICDYMKSLGTKIAQEDSVSIFEGQKLSLEDSIFYKEKEQKIVFDISYNKPFSGDIQKRLVNYIPHYTNSPIENKKFTLYEKTFKKEENSRIPGTPMMFEYIAASSLEANVSKEFLIGRTFLGVLEADIDNLSQLFTIGFGKFCLFTNLLNLSRTVDYFFTGWLNKQLQAKFKSIYAIFAGGDDLLLIGNYLEIYELAYELIRRFKFYSGSHNDVHLSLGIYLSESDNYIEQITKKVRLEIKKSKLSEDKNAITILGISMANDTYIKLYPVWQNFDSLIEGENSVRFLLKILVWIRMSQSSKKANLDWQELYKKHVTRKFGDYQNHVILSKLPQEIEEYGNELSVPVSIALYKNLKLY
ncbi:MAG: type III-A CRISPR-associated protein Cas10/Csm1 [Leptospiraceae bacterium]|nr:type III-A CRISPR-associated protein Cas10/Csm1 [Leptospiraceae bacterium]